MLVVDDNVDAANALGMLLSMLDVEYSVVHDGPGALALDQQFNPDVVLLDIGMPGMDGYAVARALRAPPHSSQALLVALTGWSDLKDHELSRAAGFDHHLRKPADISEIMQLLGSRQAAATR